MPRCTSGFRHPLLNRCRGLVEQEPGIEKKVVYHKTFDDPVAVRLGVADRSRKILGDPGLLDGRAGYNRDCSGFVLAVFAQEGIPVQKLLGVEIQEASAAWLFKLSAERGLVHYHNIPDIGDLVFFDNTFDRNGDGYQNDILTHVGVVERVDADGTVTFIHRVQRGVLRYKMNRFKPHLRREPRTRKVLNHYLRVGKQGHREKRLTGELFHAFATVVR